MIGTDISRKEMRPTGARVRVGRNVLKEKVGTTWYPKNATEILKNATAGSMYTKSTTFYK